MKYLIFAHWFIVHISAAGTAVTDDFHSAGLAFVAEIRLVESFVADRHPEEIAEFEFHRLALEAKTRFICLISL